MPKRSVNDYKPLGIRLNEQFYSSEDINKIIDAAGGLRDGEVEIESFNDGGEAVTVRLSCRDGLIAELENLANSYSVFSELQTSPTAKQKAAAFEEIEDAACDLLRALSLPEGRPKGNLLDHVPTALTYSALPDFGMNLLHFATPKGGNSLEGRKRLREAIEGVYRLKDWAGQARQAAQQHPPTGRSERHSGDPSLDSWIKGLGGVWKDIFNRKIGTSVGGPESPNAGQPGGRLSDFFMPACSLFLRKRPRTKGLFASKSGVCPGESNSQINSKKKLI